MGKYDANPPAPDKPWFDDWITALTEASHQFSAFTSAGKPLNERVHFVPITYDQKIQAYWEAPQFSRQWKDEPSLFAFLDGKLMSVFKQFIDGSAAQKEFFWTHWADVLIWRFAPEVRRLLIGFIIQKMLEANANADCSIIAHSLGTSVIHGVLNGMLTEQKGWQPGTTTVRFLGLVSCVADVHVLGHDEAPAYHAPVRASKDPARTRDLCAQLLHLHHRLDPFTWFRRYDAARVNGHNLSIGDVAKGTKPENFHDLQTVVAHPLGAYGLLSGIVPTLTDHERYTMAVEATAKAKVWTADAVLTDDDIDRLALEKPVASIEEYFSILTKYLIP